MAVVALLAAFAPAAQAGQQNHHRDAGYGVQGGVTDELALSNVFNGIYGQRYTDARTRYNFGDCRAHGLLANPDDLTIRACR